MRTFRAALRHHRWPVLVALAIFLGGTNYCVAVAIAGPGARFACAMNATAGASAEGSTAALPPCHARAAKASTHSTSDSPTHSPSKSAPARGPMPCCITLAPSAAPPDARPAIEMVLMPLPGFEPAVLPLAPWTQVPIELDTGPPGPLDTGSLSSRAPPLA